MHKLVERLENKLLPMFVALAVRIMRDFQHVEARAYSSSLPSLTEGAGHSFYVDCLLTDASDNETDNVALSVDLRFLTTQPRINADVCWGHPNAYSQAEFFADWESSSEWPVASDENLERFYSDIPRLSDALSEALRRRGPRE